MLKDEQFEEDKEKLAEFYRDEGYIDFEIKDVQFDYPDPGHMIIRFIVSEGQRIPGRLDSVQRQPALFQPRKSARATSSSKGVQMGVGTIFSPKKLAGRHREHSGFLWKPGYIDVQRQSRQESEHRTRHGGSGLSRSTARTRASPGSRRSRSRAIPRPKTKSSGANWPSPRARSSTWSASSAARARLEQMRYFDKVETEVEPTVVPNRKNLIVDVEEGPTGNFEFGAGFSSVDNLVGLVGYREGNFDLFNPPYFRGGGQKFRITRPAGNGAQGFSDFVHRAVVSEQEACRWGRTCTTAEFNYYSDLYDVTQIGGRVSLTKALGSEFLIGGVSYTLEQIGINNVDFQPPAVIKQEEGALPGFQVRNLPGL